MDLFGYIKANKLTAEHILRQDMVKKRNAIILSRDNYNSKQFDVVQEGITKTIEIRDVFSINENNIGINKKFGNHNSCILFF